MPPAHHQRKIKPEVPSYDTVEIWGGGETWGFKAVGEAWKIPCRKVHMQHSSGGAPQGGGGGA